MSIVLDTNAYSSLLFGDNKILALIESADIIYISVFVLGELYAGFRGGNMEQRNMDLLKKFLLKPQVTILNATNETSLIFGNIKNILKKAGTPLPINDVWIASHSIETDSMLISYDNHFLKIPGLKLYNF